MNYRYRKEDRWCNTAPILGIKCKNKEEYDKMVEIMFGVKKMGFEIKWNTNLYDVLYFLLCKKESREIDYFLFLEWLKGHYTYIADKICYGYSLYKEVSEGVLENEKENYTYIADKIQYGYSLYKELSEGGQENGQN